AARLSPGRSDLFISLGDRPLLALRAFPTRRSSDLSCRRPGSPAGRGRRQRRRLGGTVIIALWRYGLRKRVKPHDHGAAIEGCLKDRKSTRLNSSHVKISYAVFCLKKKSRHERSSAA